MAQFSQELNFSQSNIQTNSVYDDNVAQWMQKVQNYVQNPSGIWVPQKCNADGRTEVDAQLTGSRTLIHEDSAAVTVPASSFLYVYIPTEDNPNYTHICAGFWSADTFTNWIFLKCIAKDTVSVLTYVDILPSASRESGIAKVEIPGGSRLDVVFRNEDTVEHDIIRVVEGVRA